MNPLCSHCQSGLCGVPHGQLFQGHELFVLAVDAVSVEQSFELSDAFAGGLPVLFGVGGVHGSHGLERLADERAHVVRGQRGEVAFAPVVHGGSSVLHGGFPFHDGECGVVACGMPGFAQFPQAHADAQFGGVDAFGPAVGAAPGDRVADHLARVVERFPANAFA